MIVKNKNDTPYSGGSIPRDMLTLEEKIRALRISDRQEIIVKISEKMLNENHIITTYDNEDSFVYDDGLWECNEQKIKEIIEKEFMAYYGNPTDTRMVNEVIGHIKRRTYIDRKTLEAPTNLLCLKNGIFNIETNELLPHSPDYYFLNKINVEYHNPAECPAIEKFLSEVCPAEKIELVYEFIGYCLYRSLPIHKAFMLLGEGRNGKSTLLNLIKTVIGTENASGISLHELENNRFAAAQLYGKLANFFADIPSRDLASTSKFKALTGQDFIQGEKKFKDGFGFTNYAKLMFSANKLPQSKDESNAFYSRWIIITFPNTFVGAGADKNLFKKLTMKEELEGLLFRSIKALQNVLARGDFCIENPTEENRELYLRLSDPVWCYIQDCLEMSPEDYVVKKDLYSSFVKYCKNIKYPVSSEKDFFTGVIAHCRIEEQQKIIDSERKRCYIGIRYAQDAQDARLFSHLNSTRKYEVISRKYGVHAVHGVQAGLKDYAQDAQGFQTSSEAQGGPQSPEGVNSVGSQALSSEDGHTSPALKPAETMQKIREICAELSGSFNSIIPPKTIFEVAERRGVSIIAANTAIEALRNSGELQHVPQKGFKLNTQNQGGDS